MIVTFTTSPTRIFLCLPMIQSILNQTEPPELFILQIPHKFQRTNEEYIIPDFLKELPIKILNCDRDFGPGTKLIPTIRYLQDEKYPDNTRILYCDDDIVYPRRMLESMSKMPNHVVWGMTGIRLKKSYHIKFEGYRTHLGKVDIVEGFGGVLTTLGMFRSDFFIVMDRCLLNSVLRNADDLLFSNYFAKNQIEMRIYNRPASSHTEIQVLEYGNRSDALHVSVNSIQRYKQVFQILKHLNMDYFGASNRFNLFLSQK